MCPLHSCMGSTEISMTRYALHPRECVALAEGLVNTEESNFNGKDTQNKKLNYLEA